jgi:hypothetical protein
MRIVFTGPEVGPSIDGAHHSQAAAGNSVVAQHASDQLRSALDGTNTISNILIKAAAGAGKSHVLKRLVVDAVDHPRCTRVAVTAFQNRQLWSLATSLGETLGRERVCLFVAADKATELPLDVWNAVNVATTSSQIPTGCDVVIATSHKLGATGERTRLINHLGTAATSADGPDSPFDVLLVDEAWQLPHHRFDTIRSLAPIVVGVGDVGQLPPIEVGNNPWRGDPGYNPYRAWPTAVESEPETWSVELPAVWRPPAEAISLWRAFYPKWQFLDSVAAPGDRGIDILNPMQDMASAVWAQVATGVPTLLEVDGLPPAEASDVDLPLVSVAEALLDALFSAGFDLNSTIYNDDGSPIASNTDSAPVSEISDTRVVILATRNQAVDDATDAVDTLRQKHNLTDSDLLASTVDKWQGQTNGITLAIHPLSGADKLDEFNSAFGRLTVACTRATHGLLVLTRPGLDRLLIEAPARPGTPYGEPGTRHLPRQTHQRILATFARGKITLHQPFSANQK